jgi:hypothetical protein
LSPPTLARDVVPGKYYDYLHIFEARDNQVLLPHQHHNYYIPLIEERIPPFEPIRVLDKNRLHVLKEYLDMNLE